MPSNTSRIVGQGHLEDEDSQLSRLRLTSEIHDFVADGSDTREAFYEESQAQLDEFRETLTEFAKTLRRRKLDRKIDIKLKGTDEYTMDDVVQIATKVEELHQDAATMKTSMGAIRGFFRMAGENMPILKQILQFAPSDTYGTVIFASLSMILTGIDRARGLREEIAEAIADIPRKLESAKQYLKVHPNSQRMHTLADSVFLAVFSLLHEIVKELNKKNLAKKALKMFFKGSDYGQEVTDAIATLDTKIAAFKEGVDICSAERLSQVHQITTATHLDTKRGFIELHSDNEELKQMVRDMPRNPPSLAAPSPEPGMRSLNSTRSESEISELVQEMFEGMDLKAPSRDIKKSLSNFAKLSEKEKDKVRHIVLSDQVRTLRLEELTKVLFIRQRDPTRSIYNPITFAASLMANGMKAHHTKPIVLSFLGKLQSLAWSSDKEREVSGPQKMLNSINAQLVRQVLQRNGDRKIPLLEDKTERLRCQKKVYKGMQLFREILSTLSYEEDVIIIIELPPSFVECKDELESILKGVARSISKTRAVVKFIMLNAHQSIKSNFTELDCMELFVKAELGGFRSAVGLSKLEQQFSELDVDDEGPHHSRLQEQSNDEDSDSSGNYSLASNPLIHDSEFDTDSDDSGSDNNDSDADSGGEDSKRI